MRSASSGTTGSYRNAWQPESVRIIQKDEHIEEDDFPIRYGNPVCIHTNDGQLLVCMTYKLYERLLERKEQVTSL